MITNLEVEGITSTNHNCIIMCFTSSDIRNLQKKTDMQYKYSFAAQGFSIFLSLKEDAV